jgi:hypothetical protein
LPDGFPFAFRSVVPLLIQFCFFLANSSDCP